MQWRYQNGDDREVHLKKSRAVSQEEAEAMSKPISWEGSEPRVFEAIIGRQKFKKTFQYEIKWKGFLPK